MGTFAGDLCQRPRCWYFRSGFGLLPTHQGQDLIAEGDTRYHAIFANGPARFVSASSFGPALVALGAQIKLASAKATRTVDAAKFFTAPQNATGRETVVAPDEIVTEILVPAAPKSATYEVRQKEALDWPLAAASVVLSAKSAKIVLGHVAPVPYFAEKASAFLSGKAITEATAAQAAELALAGAQPLKDNAYKVTIAKTAVKRALLLVKG